MKMEVRLSEKDIKLLEEYYNNTLFKREDLYVKFTEIRALIIDVEIKGQK